jgi:alanyl-tRNA synthetase
MEDLPQRVEKLIGSEKELRKKVEQLEAQVATIAVEGLLTQARPLASGMVLLTSKIATHPDGIKHLREIAEIFKSKLPHGIGVFAMKESATKAALVVAAGGTASTRVHAGQLLKDLLPLIDGKGGGKADLAQAGGSKPDGIEAALLAAQDKLK